VVVSGNGCAFDRLDIADAEVFPPDSTNSSMCGQGEGGLKWPLMWRVGL
jgi:hypothetical protein